MACVASCQQQDSDAAAGEGLFEPAAGGYFSTICAEDGVVRGAVKEVLVVEELGEHVLFGGGGVAAGISAVARR